MYLWKAAVQSLLYSRATGDNEHILFCVRKNHYVAILQASGYVKVKPTYKK